LLYPLEIHSPIDISAPRNHQDGRGGCCWMNINGFLKLALNTGQRSGIQFRSNTPLSRSSDHRLTLLQII
jgi:hypothetical protein